VKRRSRRSRIVLVILAVAFAAVLARAVAQTTPLKKLELSTIDRRFDVRGTQKPRSDVVIVAADARTIGKGPDPINRKQWADGIEQLTKAGAKTIAVDVQFTDAGPNPDSDQALANAVADGHGRVILATTDVDPGGQTTIFGGNSVLKSLNALPAWSGVPADKDGRIRRVQYTFNELDAFSIVAAQHQLGHSIERSGTDAPIDYSGPARSIPTLSLADVGKGHFNPATVRGKLVVLGATAGSLRNAHATATSASMTGPELQANAIVTALDGFPLHHARSGVNWLLVVAVALIPVLLAALFGFLIGLAGGVLAIGVFLIGAEIAFGHDVIVAVVAPVAAALFGILGAALISQTRRAPWVDRVLDRLTGTKGNQRTRRLRASLLLGAAAIVLLAGLGLQAGNLLSRLEYSSVDQRFTIRGNQGPPSDIALVAIDQRTFTLPPTPQWPFKRTDHAKVIDNLVKAGAKVIAFDVQFTESSGDKKADKALLDSVRAAGPNRVVLATTEVGDDGRQNVLNGGQELKESLAVPAFSAYPNDSDGALRRLPYGKNGVVGFDLAAAQLFAGHPIKKPKGTSAWINYAGPAGTVKPLSFADVRDDNFPASAVRGKIVVVGATAPSLQDFHDTSTGGQQMAGPEVHVNGIATALDGFPLHTVPGWINTLLLILVALAAPVAGLRLGMWGAVGVGAAAVAALLVGAQIAFDSSGAIITVVYALIAGIASILFTAGIHGVTVAFEREQARDAFARFVPESVVDQVLRDAEGVRLGGVRSTATVMFSDLRGFTSFSESLEPEQVIESLNFYLTEMSEAILDHGGTLVAYMGDGIMAVFGAPLQQEDHADRALDAARDMLSRMEKFNSYLMDKGLSEGGFKMGIGLNSGPVMSGNVGSERRLEYTALGDTTNTAARMEGMTKGTPHQLFIADTTREMLTRPVEDLIQVGEAEVRGRVAKVMLWSLGGQPEPPRDAGVPEPEEVASQPEA
jgi:adenylate cyclase